jgi:hypothetical protein
MAGISALLLSTRAGEKTGWLGRQDSNLGMAESKSAALPLGYAPIAKSRRPYRQSWGLATKRPVSTLSLDGAADRWQNHLASFDKLRMRKIATGICQMPLGKAPHP